MRWSSSFLSPCPERFVLILALRLSTSKEFKKYKHLHTTCHFSDLIHYSTDLCPSGNSLSCHHLWFSCYVLAAVNVSYCRRQSILRNQNWAWWKPNIETMESNCYICVLYQRKCNLTWVLLQKRRGLDQLSDDRNSSRFLFAGQVIIYGNTGPLKSTVAPLIWTSQIVSDLKSGWLKIVCKNC